MDKKKRTWFYTLPPAAYEIICSQCGGSNLWWSEYESHIWCYDCEIDFDPKWSNAGIFSGPIPIKTSYIVGLVFDRFNMETNKVEILNLETGEYEDYNAVIASIAKLNLMDEKDNYGFWIAAKGQKQIKCGLFKLVEETRNKYKMEEQDESAE